jgi:hypothetical protein
MMALLMKACGIPDSLIKAEEVLNPKIKKCLLFHGLGEFNQ